MSELQQRQIAFAAHIRDPETNAAPTDVEDRRMAIYRELFFNNIQAFLKGYFPIAVNILGEENWEALVRSFYRDHASQTPLFTELAAEFLDYLSNEHSPAADEPPFFKELAHYEWVEGALNLAADPKIDTDITDGSLLDDAPQVSPVAWLLSYQWPVHQIDIDNQPQEPLDTPLHFLVYRNVEDKVVFNTLNAVSANLLLMINDPDNRCSGRQALQHIADELGHTDASPVIAAGEKILADWRNKGIILGTKTLSS